MMSGLWHGAAWTFVIWGALHGLYLILAQIRDKYFKFKTSILPNFLHKPFNLLFTFVLVMLAWVFFRAKGLTNAKIILQKIFSFGSYGDTINSPLNNVEMLFCWLLIAGLLLKERFYKVIDTNNTKRFYLLFVVLMIVCYFFGVFESNQFIYFQF
jgi:alginate O-acetyltransferase complex protein AlgI